jgi:hypothetical protein
MNCPDCFKDVRSLRDIYLQTIIDATQFAEKEQKKVAIIQEGNGYRYESFTGTIPEGCIEIIIPMQ